MESKDLTNYPQAVILNTTSKSFLYFAFASPYIICLENFLALLSKASNYQAILVQTLILPILININCQYNPLAAIALNSKAAFIKYMV